MNTLEYIQENKICAIVRGADSSKIDDLAKALIAGGIKIIEVTFNTDGAAEMISHLSKTYPNELLVGAGTVLDSETAKSAIDAGAKFILSPTLNTEVIKICNRYGVVPVPGIMTPTEALTAQEHGAHVVKVFPAGILTAAYIKQMLGPLNQLNIMAVGAVGLSNIHEFFEVGAQSVGIGSELVDKNLVANNEFQEIERRARAFTDAIKAL